jgi:hypothetical protein
MRFRPDSRLRSATDNTVHGHFSAMLLVGGIIFLLGMAMNALTMRGIQGNILELAGVNRNIQWLAARSRELASSREYRPGGQEMLLSKNPLPPARQTASANERLNSSSPRTRGSADPPIRQRLDTRSRGDGRVAHKELALPSAPAGKAGPDRDIEKKPPAPPPRTARHEQAPGGGLAYGKWGPPLVLNLTQGASPAGKDAAQAEGKELRSNLLTLGFDVREDHANGQTGTRTLQALNEFSLLYLPAKDRQQAPDSDQLTATIQKYATQARKDNRKFSINSGILAAIRLGSLRTGVEFSFLMELAATESSFDPTSIAPITAAAGLYQFKDDTWLEAVKIYGKKYGMGVYAAQVEHYIDRAGKKRLKIPDPVVNDYVLALRHNPRISALLAAEYVKSNRKRLSTTLAREPGHTELYLTHFFGAAGAISFLKVLYSNPDRIAGEVLPKAAEHNQRIFHPKRSKPRTVAEIYRLFERKFSRSRYKEANPS